MADREVGEGGLEFADLWNGCKGRERGGYQGYICSYPRSCNGTGSGMGEGLWEALWSILEGKQGGMEYKDMCGGWRW